MKGSTVGWISKTLSSNWSGPEGSSHLDTFSAIEVLRGVKCFGLANNGTSITSVLRIGEVVLF